MMRLWKMTEDLDLSEPQGSAIFPFLRGLEENRSELNRERMRIMQELRATLRGDNPDRRVVDELLRRLDRIKVDLPLTFITVSSHIFKW